MADANFNETVQSLFKGMDSFLTTKTVVGDAVKFDDGTTILPLVDVSFGVGAGAFCKETRNNAAGAMGGKITPNSVLVIQDGKCRLVSVKSTDMISKAIDMVPEIISKFKKSPDEKKSEEEMDKKGEEFLKDSEDK